MIQLLNQFFGFYLTTEVHYAVLSFLLLKARFTDFIGPCDPEHLS